MLFLPCNLELIQALLIYYSCLFSSLLPNRKVIFNVSHSRIIQNFPIGQIENCNWRKPIVVFRTIASSFLKGSFFVKCHYTQVYCGDVKKGALHSDALTVQQVGLKVHKEKYTLTFDNILTSQIFYFPSTDY